MADNAKDSNNQTTIGWGLAAMDPHLLNPEDVQSDHRCKETENAIRNTLQIMREATPFT